MGLGDRGQAAGGWGGRHNVTSGESGQLCGDWGRCRERGKGRRGRKGRRPRPAVKGMSVQANSVPRGASAHVNLPTQHVATMRTGTCEWPPSSGEGREERSRGWPLAPRVQCANTLRLGTPADTPLTRPCTHCKPARGLRPRTLPPQARSKTGRCEPREGAPFADQFRAREAEPRGHRAAEASPRTGRSRTEPPAPPL